MLGYLVNRSVGCTAWDNSLLKRESGGYQGTDWGLGGLLLRAAPNSPHNNIWPNALAPTGATGQGGPDPWDIPVPRSGTTDLSADDHHISQCSEAEASVSGEEGPSGALGMGWVPFNGCPHAPQLNIWPRHAPGGYSRSAAGELLPQDIQVPDSPESRKGEG